MMFFFLHLLCKRALYSMHIPLSKFFPHALTRSLFKQKHHDCPFFACFFLCLESTATFLFRHISNIKKCPFYKSCKQHFNYWSNHHTYINIQINGAVIRFWQRIFFVNTIYILPIVQSIEGLFLLNLIFTTQVCCGQLNEIGQLNAVLRYS